MHVRGNGKLVATKGIPSRRGTQKSDGERPGLAEKSINRNAMAMELADTGA